MLIEIFLERILKFDVDGSKLKISILLYLVAAYKEYKPMFEPISQKINFLSLLLKLLIQSNVSGSFVKRVSTLHFASSVGTKKQIPHYHGLGCFFFLSFLFF